MEPQNYSFVHNSSETQKSWYESESDSDSDFSRPQTSTSSLQQDVEQTCTLIIKSNEYSTIYPLLNLHLNGTRISIAIDTMSKRKNFRSCQGRFYKNPAIPNISTSQESNDENYHT